jgi:hypothetical protein
MIRSFVIGLLVSATWKLLQWLFMPPGIATDVVAVLVLPVGEEVLRLMVFTSGVVGRPTHSHSALSGACYGAGFGVFEMGWRWAAVLRGELDLSVVGLVGTLAPLLLHVALGALLWRFVALGRIVWGFLVCACLHSLHNAYVYYWVTQFNAGGFVLDIAARLILFGAAIRLLLSSDLNPPFWRTRGGE